MEHFVSTAARAYFEDLLNGTNDHPGGVLEMIDALSESVHALPGSDPDLDPEKIDLMSIPYNPFYVDHDQNDPDLNFRAPLIVWKRIEHNIKLLTTHPDMRDVYAILTKEFDNEEQWRGFFGSALKAHYSYFRHREAKSRAKELSSEIASTAASLATLLSKINNLELDNAPSEFFSAWHLLHDVDNEACPQDRLQKWMQLRNKILGEDFFDPVPSVKPPSFLSNPGPLTELVMDDVVRAEKKFQELNAILDDSKTDLETAWRAAPTVPMLLKSLAASAANFEPAQIGMVGSVVNSRKTTAHTHYIRALAYLLSNTHHIPITGNIMEAISTTTNVILYDEKKVVSRDTVYQALKNRR